jgi:hypothetical protein
MLDLAGRQVLNRLLNGLSESNLDIARKVRGIRHIFRLQEAGQEIDQMAAKRGIEYDLAIQRLREIAAAQAGGNGAVSEILAGARLPVQGIGWDELAGVKSEPFDIDDLYIRWLRDVLEKKNWHKVKKDGREIDIVVDAAFLDAVAALDEALQVKAEA